MLQRSSAFQILGWISFLAGIFGSVLFICKLLLIRKLYYIFPSLRERRNKLISNCKILSPIIKENVNIIGILIRERMRDIVMFDLLICSVEDSPQFCIVLMVGIYDGFNALSLLTLAASIALLFWKFIRIFVNYCRCQDDTVEINDTHLIDNILSTKSSVSTNNNNNNNASEGGSGNSGVISTTDVFETTDMTINAMHTTDSNMNKKKTDDISMINNGENEQQQAIIKMKDDDDSDTSSDDGNAEDNHAHTELQSLKQ